MFFFAQFAQAYAQQGHDEIVPSIHVLKIYRYLIDTVYTQMPIVLETRARYMAVRGMLPLFDVEQCQ